MTAYEFIRSENNYLKKHPTNRGYDANIIARNIIDRNPGKDVRSMSQYIEAEDAFLDATMSCSRNEALDWMKYFMANAMAYGWETYDKHWMFFFLAAYDIYESLLEDR